MKVKFYVGAMESNFWDGEEIHILTRLDYVLTAYIDTEVANIDTMLRASDKEFIRSDNKVRTFVEFDILNQREAA